VANRIALLRGINLGPNRRVAMADLRRLLADAGHEDVRTHLQSGNVLLTSDAPPEKLQRDLRKQIDEALGIDVEVVVRSRAELADAIERNPFAREAADQPKRLQVSFCDAEPDPAIAAKLEEAAAGGERVAVSGREIYAWHPDGIQRSVLAKQLADRRLGVTTTARNWNTVTKLLEMADEDAS
jgi:uncharacterized protein (DUF1697 family)